MKEQKITKRGVLQLIADYGHCYNLNCSQCPYSDEATEDITGICAFRIGVAKAGAKLMLENYKGSFDKKKICTVLDADKDFPVGIRGYAGDSIEDVRKAFDNNHVFELCDVYNDDSYPYPYVVDHNGDKACYALFYPLDEDE